MKNVLLEIKQMNKPTQKELNELLTSQQVHSQMECWAKSQQQKSLLLKTVFNDGTYLIEEYEPAQKEVFYRVKCEDNEQYSVMVDIKGRYNYQKEANLGASAIIKREKAFMKEKHLEHVSIEIIEG